MQNKTIIKKLRDDKHYYGEFGKQYISNSDIKVMRNDPEQFHAPSKTTVAMEQGKYFHQLMLEPTKSKDFPISDSTRRDAKHKAFLEEKGLDEALKTSEAQEIENLVKWFKDENNPKSQKYLEDIYSLHSHFEEPMVGKIMGYDFKCKADCVNVKEGYIIDLKTSRDVPKFLLTAKTWGYHTQALIYQSLFGMPLTFIVIGKTPKKRVDGTTYYDVGEFTPSQSTLREAKLDIEYAIRNYEDWLGKNAKNNIEDFVFKGQF